MNDKDAIRSFGIMTEIEPTDTLVVTPETLRKITAGMIKNGIKPVSVDGELVYKFRMLKEGEPEFRFTVPCESPQ